MSMIRKELESGKAIIVYDANLFLHVYLYSPDYSEYAVSCLDAIKDYLVMPSMIEIEYKKHQQRNFKEMSQRIKDVRENISTSIKSPKR